MGVAVKTNKAAVSDKQLRFREELSIYIKEHILGGIIS
jgi:hypothetical protein